MGREEVYGIVRRIEDVALNRATAELSVTGDLNVDPTAQQVEQVLSSEVTAQLIRQSVGGCKFDEQVRRAHVVLEEAFSPSTCFSRSFNVAARRAAAFKFYNSLPKG